MGWRLIKQDNVQALSILLAKWAQKNGEALGVQAGALPPEGLACRWFHRRIEPRGLIKWLDDLRGLHPVARHTVLQGQVEPEATFILAKEPHGLGGHLLA
jgi:hypothetical protein